MTTTVIYRYESVLRPDGGGETMQVSLLSKEPLKRGVRVKISKTWWVVKSAVPADEQRPQIGDKVAISTKKEPTK